MGDSAVSLPPCARDSLCSTCCHQRSPHADGRRSHSKVPSYTCVLGPALYQQSWVEFPGRLTLRQVWGREKLKRLPRSTPRRGRQGGGQGVRKTRAEPRAVPCGLTQLPSKLQFRVVSSRDSFHWIWAVTGAGMVLWLVSGCPPKPHKEETDS